MAADQQKSPTTNMPGEAKMDLAVSELFDACGQGNLAAVEQLFKDNATLDVNATNFDGDTAMHVAAATGNVDIIKFLQQKGGSFSAQTSNRDTPLHYAAMNGNLPVILYLKEQGIDLNCKNELGETPLHAAVRYNHIEVAESLILAQADINAQDERQGWTPLHVACQRRLIPMALMLLHLGCQPIVRDAMNETALHVACRENLLLVVQTICSYGCDVDLENNAGMTPLLLASRFSSSELVRCLLLAGADIDRCNRDGAKAADIALGNGRPDIADLLNRLSASIMKDNREACISQLLPTSKPLGCIKVMVFGNSGVGKTTLIESLKSGLVKSLFRRGGTALMSAFSRSSSDASTTLSGTPSKDRVHVDLNAKLSLHQPPTHLNYTRGIQIQRTNITGPGDLSFWEFSGYEPYFVTYDHFINDPNAVYLIVVSQRDQPDERKRQFEFWLDFIRCRMTAVEPIGHGGVKLWAPRVVLVATHSDAAVGFWTPDQLIGELVRNFEADLILEPHIFDIDCNQAMGNEMKTLRRALTVIKKFICDYLPMELGILKPVLDVLPDWCRTLTGFPVVSWPSFVEYIRSRVNILATEEHVREVINQLVVIGEIVHLMREDLEMIILDPQWLCSEIIGKLLAYESVTHCPLDGTLLASDLRTLFPKTQLQDVVRLLIALELCAPSFVKEFVMSEKEFIVCSLDRSEEPATITSGDKLDKSAVAGGFRVRPDKRDQLIHLYPRVINALCRLLLRPPPPSQPGTPATTPSSPPTIEHSVVHWSSGARLTRSETLVADLRLVNGGQDLIAIFRGPPDQRQDLFFFQENVCEVIFGALSLSCPALYLDRSPLSARQLKDYKLTSQQAPYAYRARDIVLAQLAGMSGVQAESADKPEMFADLITFGDQKIYSRIHPGLDQPISDLSLHARYRLARLLDPKNEKGRDWGFLAVKLDLTDQVPPVDEKDPAPISRTDTLLSLWARNVGPDATIRTLHSKLTTFDRPDVMETLLDLTPLFRYEPEPAENLEPAETAPAENESQLSNGDGD